MEFTLEIFRSAQAGDPFAFRAGEQEYVLRTPLGGAETLTLVWDETLIGELTMLRRPGGGPGVVPVSYKKIKHHHTPPNLGFVLVVL
jgi:hypothetical protein